MITNELLSEYTGKKVYWHEIVINMHVRVHYDTERYLSDYQDISILDINKYINKQSKLKSISHFRPTVEEFSNGLRKFSKLWRDIGIKVKPN